MARSSFRFGTLPVLSLAVACATAVDQGFVDDGRRDDTGGGQSSSTGGLSSTAGHSTTSGGQSPGTAGKPASMAFGGTANSGAGGTTATGGSVAAGAGGAGGKTSGGSAGATSTAGTTGGGAGGKGSGGAAGAGGKASGGAAGTSAGGAGAGGGGAGSAGTTGSAGAGGSPPSTGVCAAPNSGWVVQYWTNTPAANMPAGDVRIFNNAGGSVNFNTLELRHYFTNEETATLSFIFSTFGHNFPGAPYYEDEGGANVVSSIKALAPALPTASQYISVKFNNTPGMFGNGENVQIGYYGSLSMYPLKSNQSNDYTYINRPVNDPGSANKNSGWDHITLYAAGKLVWGCEP